MKTDDSGNGEHINDAQKKKKPTDSFQGKPKKADFLLASNKAPTFDIMSEEETEIASKRITDLLEAADNDTRAES